MRITTALGGWTLLVLLGTSLCEARRLLERRQLQQHEPAEKETATVPDDSQSRRHLQQQDHNGNPFPLRTQTRRILASLTTAIYEHREKVHNDSLSNTTEQSNETDDDERLHCGCMSCDQSVWNAVAFAGAPDDYTCGNRIQYWVNTNGAKRMPACRQVASQFDVCALCNPDTCETITDSATTDDDDDDTSDDETTNRPTRAPTRRPKPTPSPTIMTSSEPPTMAPFDHGFGEDHYCYLPYGERTVYKNVWDQGFIMEVKQDDTICDPGSNYWSNETVHYNKNTQQLTLEYKLVDGQWRAGEVRVLLPNAHFTYGTYTWSVQEITTYDSETNQVLSNHLDKDLVFGMFTWDDTENYTIHENYNHEVDIEISRFGHEQQWDIQFLVQPPEPLHYTRFYSDGGNGTTFDQGNNKTYQITWQPTQMDWWTDAAGGRNYTYTTQQALDALFEDRIQCLPANMEIRINLWNFRGAIPHSEFPGNTTVTRVVLDDFTFVPSGVTGVGVGETCSKDCQCELGLVCANVACIESTA